MQARNTLWLLVLLGMLSSSECAPTISGPLSISISEEATIGSFVTGLFDVTPGDPADVLVHSLTGSDTGYFEINAASGVLRVVTRLDRDAVTARTVFNDLLLTVTDQLGAAATASLTITITDLNDNVPSFVPTIYYVTFDENTAPGQNLVTLVCTDPDTTPGNGDITYAIAGGDDATPKFTLSANILQTSANSIDYEALSGQDYMYELIVTGTDGGAPPNTGSASIIIHVNPVNDDNPVWGSFSPAYISATSPYNILETIAPGNNVVMIMATDVDHGPDGLVTYSVADILENGANSVNNIFRVDAVSGQLMTNAWLDCDLGVQYYDVVVQASDQGIPAKSTQRSIRIGLLDVNDNSPMFSQPVYRLPVSEDVTVSSSLMTMLATDKDPSSILTYSIVNGNEALKFKLVGGAELQLQNAINLDRPNYDPIEYKLVIEVVDGGSPELTASTTVVITVIPSNDYAPDFPATTQLNFQALESSPIGHSVTTVSAEDFDYGNQGVVSYSIFSGGLGHFTIGRSSGTLKLIKEFDFEALEDSVKEVVVVASDGGGRTDTVTVTVTIGDVNDNKPVCESVAMEASVPEDAFTGTPADVFTLNCTDPDAINYLFYGVLIGDPNAFTITANGVFQRTKALDYETETGYRLVLGASDGVFTEQIQAMVRILDVNEDVPAFSSPSVSVTWSEDTSPATMLITYVATDSDPGLFGMITYSISTVSSSGASLFEVNPTSGKIFLLRSLNYDTLPAGEKYYTIVVKATDGGGLQGLGTVSIMVTDVNDDPLACFPVYRQLSLTENTPAGDLPKALESSLNCTVMVDLTFELTQTPPGLEFTIDSGSGAISLVSALDYETVKKYTLMVVVQDSRQPMPMSTTVIVVVLVTNVNEGPPTFITDYAVSVSESAPIGFSVLDISANDPDDPDTPEGNIMYSIVMGNYYDQFVIDPSSGRIRVNKNLDRESTMLFMLHVKAVEEATLASAMAILNITIDDVNDLIPRCTSYVIHASVSETSPVNSNVANFPCHDPDGEILQYTLISGDTAIFNTNDASLILLSTVDYEFETKSYEVTIRMSDGTYERDLEIIIDVTPVNEDSPVFIGSGIYSVAVPEDTAPGTLLIQVSAVDSDDGPDGMVVFSMVAHSMFLLDGGTGKIILQNYLDYETTSSHTLEIIAADMGIPAKTSTATIEVSVVNQNEGPPVFNPKIYAGSVSADSTVGTTVLTLTASDIDSGVEGEITYSLLSGSTGNVFRVEKDGASGECNLIIHDVTTLDDDNLSSYELKVQASDGGGGLAEASVLLRVTYVNEFAPVFIPPASTNFSLAESSLSGTTLVELQATDADAGLDGEITYSLTSGHMWRFTIDRFTGVVSVIHELDRETVPLYMLEVLATDRGVSPSTLSATLSLTVHVTDVNDMIPVCTMPSLIVTTPENTALSTSIYQLSCTDSDEDGPNSELTYDIFAGTGKGHFSVDSTTGQITTASMFDHESENQYFLSINVSDQGTPSLYNLLNMKVLITDVNDNDPQFCCSPYTVAVSEDIPNNEPVLQVEATDLDSYPAGKVLYSMLSGNAGNKFSIDVFDGVIVTSGQLDRESMDSYSLVILAKDAGVPSRSASATVIIEVNDVNDNAPSCPASIYNAYVDRNVSLPHSILTISCSDMDENNSVTYSLVTAGIPFSIDSSTGELIVSEDLSNPPIIETYYVNVSASDGLLFSNILVIIEVFTYIKVEDPPVFTPAGPVNVSFTETTVRGTMVTQVTAMAVPSTHILSFSITAGNAGNVFEMKNLSGIIQTMKPVDYESQAVYELEVTVVDISSSELFSASTTVIVNIVDTNNYPPVCNPNEFTTKIPESYSGTLLTITCTDGDSSSVLTYSILSANDSFSIDPNTGELSTAGTLDYEDTATYDIVVESTDGEFSSWVLVRVTVEPINEHPPVFPVSAYRYITAEDTLPGTPLLFVMATDQDVEEHGTQRYSIVGGNEEQKFMIDSVYGVVTLFKKLDREQAENYTLIARAVDCKGVLIPESLTATIPVIIFVTDKNDNFPKFTPKSYMVNVLETAPGGSILLTVTATDDDPEENGRLTFSIVSGNDDAIFNMTGRNLVMNLGSSLSYETRPFHFLVVEAWDNGMPPLSAQATVTVAVNLVNKFPPIMVTNSSVTIAEDTPIGTVIFTASATDNDTATSDNIVYSIITDSTPASPFFISSLTGNVQVSSALDFDTGPTVYVLEILAQENHGSGTAFSTTTTLSVTLTPVNDHTPVFQSNKWSFMFAENINASMPIGTVVATDGDSGPSGNITYTIVVGNTTLFSVDGTNGEIKAVLPGDAAYRLQKYFSLMISATDAGSPPLSSDTVVLLTVIESNLAPVFPLSDVGAFVSEFDAIGTQVLVLYADDSDSGDNGLVSYSLFNTTAFTIGSSSGVITTVTGFDRETKDIYVFGVMAEDHGSPPLSDNCTVTVVVNDVNDNRPVVKGIYNFAIPEDSTPGIAVTKINVSDADIMENAALNFEITSGNSDNFWALERDSGVLKLVRQVDYETVDFYSLVVRVRDKGDPPLSTFLPVTVTIEDVNEFSPVFSSSNYSFVISENTLPGSSVWQITATDEDAGINAEVEYTLVDILTGVSDFTVDSIRGDVLSVNPLDRETLDNYVLVFRASDKGVPKLYSDVQVNITITDINDNSPMLTVALSGSVMENCAIGTSLLQVQVSDSDLGLGGKVVLSIMTSTSEGARADQLVAVNASTLLVTTKSDIDRETDPTLDFVLVARDQGTPSLSSSTEIHISVMDENDNHPVMNKQFDSLEVAFDGKCTEVITSVSATDADLGQAASVSYYTNDSSDPFFIEEISGDVRLIGLAYAGATYVLEIYGVDNGSPALASLTPTVLRIDALDLSADAVSFALLISRDYYLAHEDSFLSNLTAVIKSKYQNAVVKRWCIEEVEGSSSNLAQRRRLLSAGMNPIMVHVYVLEDGSPDSLEEKKKTLSSEKVLSLVVNDFDGSLLPELSGGDWDNFGIFQVVPYKLLPSSKLTFDVLTIGCSIVGGLLFLVVTATIFYCSMVPLPNRYGPS
ncbi:protocadherin Fat 4-like [Liolophura sinensis]|uniref:protocadherin Fat 4-like n=1 Tax=Liolophura sinensis TaxID=3198878 RepID=UPI003158786B